MLIPIKEVLTVEASKPYTYSQSLMTTMMMMMMTMMMMMVMTMVMLAMMMMMITGWVRQMLVESIHPLPRYITIQL